MEGRSVGPAVIVVGLGVVALGLLIWTGALSWFGRLPGDVRVERDGLRIFFPLTSMILVSIALTLLSYLVRRFF
ncbi:MAG TPA: DUF2905 domain-containing protein [Gemmatimonadales bacterium]|jgi:hypothetical protein|nr:DUF2905 domain-containing protein [Gemmatimonadales bacterium]